MPVIFAFISFFTWGFGVLFEAIAAKKINSYLFTFWAAFISFIICTLIAPFFLKDLNGITLSLFMLNIVLAFFFHFGTIMYYEGIKAGAPALVGAVASSFSAVIVIIALLFLGDKINSLQIVAIILIIIGIILSSLDLNEIRKKKINLEKSALFALVAMISWGISLGFVKILVEKIGWFWPNYITFGMFPLLFLFIKSKKIKITNPIKSGVFIPFIISILFVRIAEFSYNFAIGKGSQSIVASISGANPILFVVLAFFVFKDKIKRQQIIGILSALAGIVLISIIV